MIKLTKLNKEPFIINCGQIERIEMIPESKIIMMNKEIYEWHQKMSIEQNDEENLLW